MVKKRIKKLVLLIALLGLIPLNACETVFFDPFDPFFPFTPFEENFEFFVPDDFFTIQEAIDFAIPGDRVIVRAGVYAPSTNGEIFPIFLKNGVDVFGEDPLNTIVDAEFTHGVFDAFLFDSSFQNFTIINGLAKRGGGLFIEDSQGDIQNLYILGNQADEEGSGVFIKNSNDILLRNLVISANIISTVPGGDPTQVDIQNSNILFYNNVVANGDSDGLRVGVGSTGIYENNIFFQNGAAGFGVGFADQNSISNAVIQYNLFFANVENDFFLDGMLYTAAEANALSPGDAIDFNFNDNPLFTDPAAELFTLQAGSPAIGAGNPDSAFNNINGSRNDIGAFGGPHAIFP